MDVLDRNVVACNPLFLDATPVRRYEIRRRDDAMRTTLSCFAF